MWNTLIQTMRLKLFRIGTNYEDRMNSIKPTSSLHRSIRCVLMLAQSFGLMPIQGITSDDSNDLKFQWSTFVTIYSLVNLTVGIAWAVMNIWRFATTGMNFGEMVSIIYFTSISVVIMMFIKIARRWAKLSKKWLVMEITMKKYEYQPNLGRRFKITTLVVMLLALGEHLLFITKLVNGIMDCSLFQVQPIKTYFETAFAQIFELTAYAFWKGWILEFFNILATFAWNFMDLFIMLMCAAMAERFKQINKRVERAEFRNEHFWKEIREDYNRLAILCKYLDASISHLISLSFANNLFFICVQLFNSLKPISGWIHAMYFCGSFGFLLGRTSAVCMYAAWINDESTGILGALFDVPSEHFGPEASRLIQQITSYPIAITGSNYFIVTRDLCLKVAGAIMTFELILQQMGPMFLNTDGKEGDKPFCPT